MKKEIKLMLESEIKILINKYAEKIDLDSYEHDTDDVASYYLKVFSNKVIALHRKYLSIK